MRLTAKRKHARANKAKVKVARATTELKKPRRQETANATAKADTKDSEGNKQKKQLLR